MQLLAWPLLISLKCFDSWVDPAGWFWHSSRLEERSERAVAPSNPCRHTHIHTRAHAVLGLRCPGFLLVSRKRTAVWWHKCLCECFGGGCSCQTLPKTVCVCGCNLKVRRGGVAFGRELKSSGSDPDLVPCKLTTPPASQKNLIFITCTLTFTYAHTRENKDSPLCPCLFLCVRVWADGQVHGPWGKRRVRVSYHHKIQTIHTTIKRYRRNQKCAFVDSREAIHYVWKLWGFSIHLLMINESDAALW